MYVCVVVVVGVSTGASDGFQPPAVVQVTFPVPQAQPACANYLSPEYAFMHICCLRGGGAYGVWGGGGLGPVCKFLWGNRTLTSQYLFLFYRTVFINK